MVEFTMQDAGCRMQDAGSKIRMHDPIADSGEELGVRSQEIGERKFRIAGWVRDRACSQRTDDRGQRRENNFGLGIGKLQIVTLLLTSIL